MKDFNVPEENGFTDDMLIGDDPGLDRSAAPEAFCDDDGTQEAIDPLSEAFPDGIPEEELPPEEVCYPEEILHDDLQSPQTREELTAADHAMYAAGLPRMQSFSSTRICPLR